MWEHRHNIVANTGKGLSDHFNRDDHIGVEDVQLVPLTQVDENAPARQARLQRLDLEKFFMDLFRTGPPQGLNTKEEVSKKIIPVVINYTTSGTKWFNAVRGLYQDHIRARYPNVFPHRLVGAFRKWPNFGELVSAAKTKGRPTQIVHERLPSDDLRTMVELQALHGQPEVDDYTSSEDG